MSERGYERNKEDIIEQRKEEHVALTVSKNTVASYNFWDDVILEHNALPEIDYDEIDTTTTFLKKKIGLPLMITGITGGFKKAKDINAYLAKIAEKYQIPMSVGSQRAMLIKKELTYTYSVVKDYDIPLRVANIGAPQLKSLSIDDLRYLADEIDAHAIAIHLNYLQEIVQPEGDREARGVLEKIKEVSRELGLPIIVKETGAGISRTVAMKLIKSGISAIDSSGVSGTSFSAVEYYRALRAQDERKANLGRLLWDWGIPAPLAVMECKKAIKSSHRKVYIIGSGGIRHGLDIARAIVLGADIAGIARRALDMYFRGEDLEPLVEELKAVMFLTGSRTVKHLKDVRYYITGRLADLVKR
ncbi:MAG: type 2 isopentenyl-diphosphate Delta-isomerase [Euryarchaeota archaeon]|nr:type 2 isopentenyl-diphosphate Delta-isomerase [Euryarchaeota archaeon]